MEVRSATTDEMVLAFVRAEIDSPTERGKLFLDVLARICADRASRLEPVVSAATANAYSRPCMPPLTNVGFVEIK